MTYTPKQQKIIDLFGEENIKDLQHWSKLRRNFLEQLQTKTPLELFFELTAMELKTTVEEVKTIFIGVDLIDKYFPDDTDVESE